MKRKIMDCFDFEMASTLLEGFNKSTGFVTAIIDLDGNILSKSGWRQICTDFHRKNPETASNCIFSDTKLASQIRKDEKYHFYKCINGLIDVGLPILIKGEHIANLFCGQFFFEKPDISFFKKQAKQYGFDERAYIEALENVPIVSKEKVEVAIVFLVNIVQMIIEMTVEKLDQIELNEKLRKSEASLSESQAQLKQNMNDLLESQRIAHLGTWSLNLATNQVVWSEELYKMYGFDPTIPPPPYTEHMKLFTPESWDKLSTSLEQTRTSGIPYELELETVTNGGSNGWMWARGEAVKDSDGNIISLWGAAQDITERKKAEKTSKENVFRFQSLFNEMSAGGAIYKVLNDGGYGKDYIIQDFNKAALKAEEKEKTEVLGRSLYDLRPNIDQYGLIPIFQRVWKTGEPTCYPTKQYIDENFANWYENHIFKLPSGEIVAIFEDVTEKSLAEESVRKQNDLFVSLLNILPIGVFMVDSVEGKPLVVNEMGKALLGSGILPDTNEHNLSEVYKAYKGDTQKQYPAAEMPITLGMKGISSHIDDMIVEHLDGTRILLEVFGTPVNDVQGKPWASLVAFMDITDRKKAESDLLYLSYHDHLTGLYNRGFFENELKRLDTNQNFPLSIIMCDINGLKLINDSFGHDIGDALLKSAAEIIKKACRKEDIIARIGGDEFVVILPKTTEEYAQQISNHIKELASKEKVDNVELSIACGYDTKTSDNQSIIELISNAENHMYQHKLSEHSSMRSKTIDIIMNTLFAKSKREAVHSNRVSRLCIAIGSKMNLNKDVVNQLRIAGLIHDIGKIGIDEKILNKAGNLSFDERKDIERHPEIGWRLLSSTNEFSELAQFVLNHHEKWDGSGYPNGVKGLKIPLEARIISVADSYDAMTSKRSYRNGLSKEEAVKELMRCSGTQFDPEIVDMFVNQVLSDKNFRVHDKPYSTL